MAKRAFGSGGVEPTILSSSCERLTPSALGHERNESERSRTTFRADVRFLSPPSHNFGAEVQDEPSALEDSLVSDFESTRFTSTRATPFLVIPISCAARLDRSRPRPRPPGRSLIRTFTERPVAGLVTITEEPIGKLRDAAVKASGSYGSPLAVRCPAYSSPRYEALTALDGFAPVLRAIRIGRGTGDATAVAANDGCGLSCCVVHKAASKRVITASAARTSRPHLLILNDYSPSGFSIVTLKTFRTSE